MDTNHAYIAGAILVAIVVFSNLILYGIARSMIHNTRKANFMKGAQTMLRNPLQKEDAALDELRKRVEELESKRKENRP